MVALDSELFEEMDYRDRFSALDQSLQVSQVALDGVDSSMIGVALARVRASLDQLRIHNVALTNRDLKSGGIVSAGSLSNVRFIEISQIGSTGITNFSSKMAIEKLTMQGATLQFITAVLWLGLWLMTPIC